MIIVLSGAGSKNIESLMNTKKYHISIKGVEQLFGKKRIPHKHKKNKIEIEKDERGYNRLSYFQPEGARKNKIDELFSIVFLKMFFQNRLPESYYQATIGRRFLPVTAIFIYPSFGISF